MGGHSSLKIEAAPSLTHCFVEKLGYFSVLLLCVYSLISTTSTQATEVYKEVRPDGSVVFTDTPKDTETEPLEVDLTPNMVVPSVVPSTINRPAKKESPRNKTSYESLIITSPAHDSVVRANDGTIRISAQATPQMHPTHQAQLKMNGSAVGSPQSSLSFTVNGVNRGSHSFVIIISDRTGKTLISSKSITVHLKRASALFKKPNQDRRIAEQ